MELLFLITLAVLAISLTALFFVHNKKLQKEREQRNIRRALQGLPPIRYISK